METITDIPHMQVVMTFVATCVESTSRLLHTSYREVYRRMKRVGMIEHYIIPHYETLHTESRDNLAKGLIECLNNLEKAL